MSELKPCPFCGGNAEIIYSHICEPTYALSVRCVDCHIGTSYYIFSNTDGLDEAIDEMTDEWNTRAVVTCDECLYCASPKDTRWCAKFGAYRPSAEGFCAWGERRWK